MEHRKEFSYSFTTKEDSRRLNLAKFNRSSRRNVHHRNLPQTSIYAHRLMSESYMTSSSLIDSSNFLLMPLPQGDRVILVSNKSTSSLYTRSGKYIGDVSIPLPEGFELDCISASDGLYVRDALTFFTFPAIARFEMLHKTLQGVPNLSVLPVFDCTASDFARLKGSDVLFYHKDSQYSPGPTQEVFLWTPRLGSDIVNLRCCYDGTLKTSEGRNLFRLPKKIFQQIDLALCDVVRCRVTGVTEWHIEHLELIDTDFEGTCFSLSQVLYWAANLRPSDRDVEEALRSNQMAARHSQITLNSSTASSQSDYEEVAFGNIHL